MKNIKAAGPRADVISRRQFLKTAGIGTLGIVAGGILPKIEPPAVAHGQNKQTTALFVPDLDIELTAIAGEVSIFPGEPTEVWHYEAKVHKGNPNRLSVFFSFTFGRFDYTF